MAFSYTTRLDAARRHFTTPTGRWLPITATDGTELFNIAKVAVTRYRWRSNKIPNTWIPPT